MAPDGAVTGPTLSIAIAGSLTGVLVFTLRNVQMTLIPGQQLASGPKLVPGACLRRRGDRLHSVVEEYAVASVGGTATSENE